MKIFKHKKSG